MEEFRKQFNITKPPKTITLQDAILISSPFPLLDVTCLSQLPAYMLSKIMMLDSKSRHFPESIVATQNTPTRSIAEFMNRGSHTSSQDMVNPMDVFLYLFILSHPVFRQTLVTQVAKCQLSLPLIISYPSTQEPTLYLFALKTLHKDYIREDNSSISFSVSEEKMSIISFMRVGDCGKSQKSEMLNIIIGIPDYFSNRNQLGSSKKRYFLDGTVEIAWFFPKSAPNILGHENNLEPCVLLNLRGNAFSYPKLCEFLTTVSTFLYVFVPINRCDQSMSDNLTILEKMMTSKVKFLLYNEDSPIETGINFPKFFSNEESFLLLEKNNLGEDCKLLYKSICSLLLKIPTFRMSLNDFISIAKRLLFKIDSDEFNLINCELLVDSILKRMLAPINDEPANNKSRPLAIVKNRMLPLQGDTWSNWANANRELHNLEPQGFENIKDRQELLMHKMLETRQNQVKMLRKPSQLLKDIFEHCKIFGQYGGDFYIIWKLLQNIFNVLSKAHLPPLYEEYRTLHKLKCSNSGESVDRIQVLLKEAAKNITESSLGIEHVFRELGQVFEAYMTSNNSQKQDIERRLDFRIRTLDDIFASLLVEGHAFEIIDGDVNHVPIEWVTSVLQSLALKIGNDKRIFVLSILGTQSTGKSTLLNTMFGADFPVSSGRCTRGIFMQLIPIAESLRAQLGYDYLVLLDTEGLRAPELSINSSYKRDNELATFAVGLGDATVINMYGESHSDVQDILQIIVFAIIRMKESYSKPRCIFVHQNVPDTHAHTKLLTARSNLMKTLDSMTKSAAQQENRTAFYKQFCDVIEFSPEEEVFYFPGLFEGEPPQNRISNAYVKSTAKLRAYILNCFNNDKKKRFQTVEEWSYKLKTLWKSVLQENFVFSYRNALEVTARFELDHELSCWHSKYIQAMTQWKSEFINLLFNADLERLEETWDHIISELREEQMNSKIESKSQEKLMKLFFFEHENVEIMTQWKENIRLHIEKKREAFINELGREFEMIYGVQQTKKEMDRKFSKCRREIISKVNSLFIEMKNQGRSLEDKTLVESKFQSIWDEWKSQIEVNEISKNNICRDLQKAFSESPIIKSMNVLPCKSELLTNPSRFLEIGKNGFEYLSQLVPLQDPEYFLWKDLVKKTIVTVMFSAIWGNTRRDAGINRFKSEVQIIEAECERCLKEYLSPLLNKMCPYDPNSFIIIIEEIYEIIDKHKTSLQDRNVQESIELTTEFIFDYIFYQCCKAIPTLEKLEENFISRTSLDFKFNQLEHQLKEIFFRLCVGIRNEYSCALELANITFEAMKEYLSDSIPDIYLCVFLENEEYRVSYQDRASLILAILKDLAREKNFQNYISYINDPFNYMIVYTQNKLKNHFMIEDVKDTLSKRVIERVTSLVEIYHTESLNACFISSESSSHDNWKIFKKKFHLAIKTKVRNLSYNDFDVLDIHTIENYEQFCQLFSSVMQDKIIESDWNSWIECILESEESLYTRLTVPLTQCNSLCPFCREPCQLSIGDHEHYCGTFHRPVGVNGWHHVDSKEISPKVCTTSIKHKRTFLYRDQRYEYVNYKTVNDYFKLWKILGEDSLDSKYWLWVLYTFENEFVEHYGIVKNKYISCWEYLTEEEVMDDLDKHYRKYIHRND